MRGDGRARQSMSKNAEMKYRFMGYSPFVFFTVSIFENTYKKSVYPASDSPDPIPIPCNPSGRINAISFPAESGYSGLFNFVHRSADKS
jgi:hypothetical protein